MENKEQLAYLRSFVKEVQQYYIQCKFAEEGAFSIPRHMVSYALSGLDATRKSALLEGLSEHELILAMDEQKIIFSHAFLDGQCQGSSSLC
jgi:hypothetical protein